MHRQTQGQGGYGAKTAYGGTDWQALEVQLNRTRNILQEILVHLQEVLRNLKMARNGGRGFAASASADAGGSARFGAKDARSRAQATPPPHGSRGQRTQAGQAGQASAAGANGTSSRAHTAASGTSGTGSRPHAAGAAGSNGTSGKTHAAGAGTSDWFRARSRQGSETRTEAGPGKTTRTATGPEAASEKARSRTTTTSGEKARPSEGWSFRAGAASSRTHASGSQTSRERPRAESTFRAASGTGTAGAEREARQGQTSSQTFASASRAHARTATRTATGFRVDQDRQSRARQMARRSGMNLKCAYDILCLDYPCTVDEIKVAYRHMARLFHPDLGGDEEAMKDVNVAYELAMRFCAGPRRASAAWAV